jgi:hypothetical protein
MLQRASGQGMVVIGTSVVTMDGERADLACNECKFAKTKHEQAGTGVLMMTIEVQHKRHRCCLKVRSNH